MERFLRYFLADWFSSRLFSTPSKEGSVHRKASESWWVSQSRAARRRFCRFDLPCCLVGTAAWGRPNASRIIETRPAVSPPNYLTIRGRIAMKSATVQKKRTHASSAKPLLETPLTTFSSELLTPEEEREL